MRFASTPIIYSSPPALNEPFLASAPVHPILTTHPHAHTAVSHAFIPTPESPLVDAHAVHSAERDSTLGTKQIGTFLSFIFMVNQIYGPGVLAIPIVFQQSGWFPTTVVLLIFMLLSCMASTLLADAIASIPGNRYFQQRVEFGNAVKYFFGRRYHFAFQIFLNITLQSINIASIIICAQSLDQAMMAMAGHTWALQLSPSFAFEAFDDIDALYSSSVITISLGYLIIMALFLPQGFQNLSENVRTVQLVSFFLFLGLIVELIVYFIWEGEYHKRWTKIPAVGKHYTQLVSVFIFSWAFVIYVPSWLNEKHSSVSVNKVIWWSGLTSFGGYLMVGLLCASVFANIQNDDVLSTLSKNPTPIVTQVSAYLFSLAVIATGIPVCSVTTRYNLYVSRTCSKRWSYFWGVFAPWLIGFVFCQGQLFATFLSWTSLIFNGIVNLVVPFLLYIRAQSLISAAAREHDVDADIDQNVITMAATADDMIASKLFVTDSPIVSSLWRDDKRVRARFEDDIHSITTTHDDLNETASTLQQYSPGVILDASSVHPLPVALRPHGRHIAIVLCIITIILIITQAAVDLYCLIAKHENVLAS